MEFLNKSRYYFFILIVILGNGCSLLRPKIVAEDSTDYAIKGNFDIVEIDKLNNIFTQSENNILRRYQIGTKSIVDYVDNRLGKIDDLDPFDPLNILIFYQSYGIIKVMDNTLNVIKMLNFRESTNYQNVVNVCSSNDGRYWIFDESLQKIIKINISFEKIAETNRLSDLGINSPSIIKMRESDNRLFVLIKEVGILVFDNFGQYLRKIVVPAINDFSVMNGVVYYSYQRELFKVEGIDTRKVNMVISKSLDQPTTAFKLNNQYLLSWYTRGVNIDEINP